MSQLVTTKLRKGSCSHLSKEAEGRWWVGGVKRLYSFLVSFLSTKKFPPHLYYSPWFFSSYPGFACSRSSTPSFSNLLPIATWRSSAVARADHSHAHHCLCFSSSFWSYSPSPLNLDGPVTLVLANGIYIDSWPLKHLLSCFPIFLGKCRGLNGVPIRTTY